MKAQNNNSNQDSEMVITDNIWLMRITIGIFVLILNICVLSAQDISSPTPKLGMGVEFLASGNGHGIFTAPYISMSKGANMVSVAPMLQKCTSDLNGLKVTYSRNLSTETPFEEGDDYASNLPDLFQLNFFGYFQHVNNASLCPSTVKHEQRIKRNEVVDISQIKFNTTEVGSGIEFRVNFTQRISWRNFVGASLYYHHNYHVWLDHAKVAPGLQLATAIHITIK